MNTPFKLNDTGVDCSNQLPDWNLKMLPLVPTAHPSLLLTMETERRLQLHGAIGSIVQTLPSQINAAGAVFAVLPPTAQP
jgi:hypothetical protein